MSMTRDSSVSFEETDTRDDEMNSTIEQWIDELVAGVDDAQASAEFQEWLDVQSRFHDYSYRNTLLIKQQCPEATRSPGRAGRTPPATFGSPPRESPRGTAA